MKKLKYIIILILFLIVFGACYILFIKKESDAVKFKKEYEQYNNEVAYKDYKYQKLTISSNNNIKYATYDDISFELQKGTAVIYFGFPQCPWCRTMLPILLDVVEDYEIDEILYMNIYDMRDSYEVVDGNLQYKKDEDGNEIKGTEDYFKLLKSLDEYLEEYIVTDEDGNDYITGEKRIYAPTVVFVDNGSIIGVHVGTVDSQESGFDKLTKDQKEELYGIFEDYIIELKDLTCKNDKNC